MSSANSQRLNFNLDTSLKSQLSRMPLTGWFLSLSGGLPPRLFQLFGFPFGGFLGFPLLRLSDGLKDFLLVRIHFGECFDLRQVDVLAIAQSNDLVEGEDQVESVLSHVSFFQLTVFRDHPGRRRRE